MLHPFIPGRILFLLGLLCLPAIVRAQNITQAYRTYEITFLSDRDYGHPVRDVQITCVFSHSSGATVNVHGFWDGGRTYLVRFAPHLTGRWEWRTSCSDQGNGGLHDQSGSFRAVENEGAGLFEQNGWLRASADGRYLEYESGKPFFWLACTAWEMTMKSHTAQVEAYLDDRKEKDFTAIQIVVLSHQRIEEFGVRNRNGAPSFLNEDFSLPNPEYFRYLDTIVRKVNDHDMVAVLVPMWAAVTYLYPNSGHQYAFDHDEAIGFARYLGARYAGSNVAWIIGGDNSYDTDARKAFWSEVGRTIKAAGGDRHLATVHPRGYEASFQSFDNTTDWLDFHMYQSSHVAGGNFTWEAGLQGYSKTPPVPVVNGEATYEDIYNNLWEPGDTLHPNSFRIRAEHVRQSSYESILSGALVGITYGGNGVWQWHVPDPTLFVTHRPRFYVEQAWEFPGSTHMGVLRRILTGLSWHRFVPRQDLLLAKGTAQYIAVAKNDGFIVTYVPTGTDWVALNASELSGNVCYYWVNPTDGDTTLCVDVDNRSDLDSLVLVPPDLSDWLLVLSNRALSDVPDERISSELRVAVVPNPFFGSTTLEGEFSQTGTATLTVWNALGVRVGEHRFKGSSKFSFDLGELEAGTYFYRVDMATQTRHAAATGKFVSLGF